MSTSQDREITQQHVAAILQGYGFVADARRFGARSIVAFATAEPFAPDEAPPHDGDIVQVFAPDKAVVEVSMAEVLVTIGSGIRLGRVVASSRGALHGGFACDNNRAGLKVERHPAPEVNGVGEVGTGREANSAAAGRARRFDGAIDSRRVVSFAISGGTMLANIERMGGSCGASKRALSIGMRQSGRSHKASDGGMPQKTSAVIGHLVSLRMKLSTYEQKIVRSQGVPTEGSMSIENRRLTIKE
jgi:hypothetical protein